MAGERVWWASALQWALWGVLMSITMAWIGRSRNRKSAGASPGELRHPVAILILGVITTIAFLGFALMAFLTSQSPVEWWVYAIFVGLAALGGYLVAEYFVLRFHVDDAGIRWSTLFLGKGEARWTDIRRVTFSPSMKWFRLETSTGRVLRISVMLTGLPELARLLVTRLPHEVIEKKTLAILKDATIGNLPSVWG